MTLAPDLNLIFPLLVGMMLIVAIVGNRDRKRLLAAATVLVGGWIFFIAAFSNHPPAELFWRLGIMVRSEDLWPLSDALQAVLMLAIAYDRRWGWMLWALLTAQQPLHFAYHQEVIEYARYSRLLDLSFLTQLAVVFTIGGPGVRDRVVRFFHSRRDARHPTLAARSEWSPLTK